MNIQTSASVQTLMLATIVAACGNAPPICGYTPIGTLDCTGAYSGYGGGGSGGAASGGSGGATGLGDGEGAADDGDTDTGGGSGDGDYIDGGALIPQQIASLNCTHGVGGCTTAAEGDTLAFNWTNEALTEDRLYFWRPQTGLLEISRRERGFGSAFDFDVGDGYAVYIESPPVNPADTWTIESFDGNGSTTLGSSNDSTYLDVPREAAACGDKVRWTQKFTGDNPNSFSDDTYQVYYNHAQHQIVQYGETPGGETMQELAGGHYLPRYSRECQFIEVSRDDIWVYASDNSSFDTYAIEAGGDPEFLSGYDHNFLAGGVAIVVDGDQIWFTTTDDNFYGGRLGESLPLIAEDVWRFTREDGMLVYQIRNTVGVTLVVNGTTTAIPFEATFLAIRNQKLFFEDANDVEGQTELLVYDPETGDTTRYTIDAPEGSSDLIRTALTKTYLFMFSDAGMFAIEIGDL